MAYDIGPRIGIQGEAEFNKQIKQINNAIRELSLIHISEPTRP